MMKRHSFFLYLAPDGSVHELTTTESKIAKKLCGWEVELKPGGMIVMSTDVNVSEDKASLINKAKSFMKTWYNRIMRTQKVDDRLTSLIREKGLETGWSMGNLFKGRYLSPKSKETYNEKSFAIDIRGVDFQFVKEAGRRLGKEFGQESVLLVDHSNGRTFLLGVS